MKKILDFIDAQLTPTRTCESPFVIGDVHGCGDQFEELILKIYECDRDAEIFQLGDLIDRGPDLLRVIDLCIEHNVTVIRGNHEQSFLSEFYLGKTCRSKARQRTHDQFHHDCNEEEQQRILTFLSATIPYIHVHTGYNPWILSHSKIEPSVGPGSFLNYGTSRRTEITPDDWCFHVHSHQAWDYEHIEGQILNNGQCQIFNVDAGCCFGGELLGMRLTDKKIIKVKGYDYCEYPKEN